MPVPKMHFQCPDCACDLLEEVSRSITYSTIGYYYSLPDRNFWFPNWEESETEELDVIRYQCRDCGFTVHNGHCSNIYLMLKQKGWIREDIEDDGEDADWEV